MVWLPAIVIFVYLAIVLYIGIFAFRRGKGTGEDFFLAGRSIGSIVFFLSLFATNMTAFAIIGGAVVALVVMGNVFFGGMRGAVLVNVFQTLLFLSFGAIAFWAIGKHVNFTETVGKMVANPAQSPLLTRASGANGIPPGIPKL